MPGPVRSYLNKNLTSLVEMLPRNCEAHNDSLTSQYVVWKDSSMIKTVDYIVNEMIGPTGINDIISLLTDNTNSISLTFESKENIHIDLSGLNSFYAFQLLYPIVPPNSTNTPTTTTTSTTSNANGITEYPVEYEYTLGNNIALGYCLENLNCNPFSISVTYTPSTATATATATNDNQASNNVKDNTYVNTLHLSFENFDILLNLFALYDKTQIKNLKLSQLENPGCFMSAFQDIEISNLNFSSSNVTSTINGIKTNYSDQKKDITQQIDAIFRILGSNTATDYVNNNVMFSLSNAQSSCYGATNEETTKDPEKLDLYIQLLIPITIAAAIALAYIVWHHSFQLYRDIESITRSSKFLSNNDGNSTIYTPADKTGYLKKKYYIYYHLLCFNNIKYLCFMYINFYINYNTQNNTY